MAARRDYKRCKGCGYEPTEDEPNLSATGLCIDCGTARQREALTQIAEHRGPYFRHWRKQMAASVGGVLVDDLRETA